MGRAGPRTQHYQSLYLANWINFDKAEKNHIPPLPISGDQKLASMKVTRTYTLKMSGTGNQIIRINARDADLIHAAPLWAYPPTGMGNTASGSATDSSPWCSTTGTAARF